MVKKEINFIFQEKSAVFLCIFMKNGYFCHVITFLTTMEKDLNRIKVILAEKKRTNKWLAEQLNCAQTTVSKWCTNSCQPPMETFIKIAKLLEVDLNELVRIE